MQPVGINDDPRYGDGSGSDEIRYVVPLREVPDAALVRATLYYQSIPPNNFKNGFRLVSVAERQGCINMLGHLNVTDLPMAT